MGPLPRHGSDAARARAFGPVSRLGQGVPETLGEGLLGTLGRAALVEERNPHYPEGRKLRFSLRANPTVKRMRGKSNPKEDNGYRVSLCYPKYALAFLDKHGIAVSDEEKKAVEDENGDGRELRRDVVERALVHWLSRKGEAGGFEVEGAIPIQEGFRHLWRPAARTRNGRRPDMSFRSVLYEGTLKVTDATRLLGSLTSGIGPGKAFGFGLLSVAPC